MRNPFPGPQPYRAEDRERYFGRGDLSYKLQGAVLTHRCVTVYGPSGAGKSSLLQASVLPELIDRQDIRVLRVDAWPENKNPTKWLAEAMNAAIGLGELSDEQTSSEAVIRAAKGATRGSSRLLVVYLDQLEQLLFSTRSAEEVSEFFECLEAMLDLPLRSLRVVLSLREDYLGRFRDRLRDMYRVTENGFRVGPLSVGELSESVVAAAAAGEPAQEWNPDEMRKLMLQVRVPGQTESDNAEAQSAYAQIVCRALFGERAAGKTADIAEAEVVVQRYFEETLEQLGDLRRDAERLLEEHLVGADGSRTLRTEKELARVLAPEGLSEILRRLEGAAILRAEEHQGSRYFELGHDWLARRVFEGRQARERTAEQKRIEEEQRKQIESSRIEQRRLRRIATAALLTTALVGASGILAWIARSQAIDAQHETEKQRLKAVEAEGIATNQRDEANDLRVMAGAEALSQQGDRVGAMKLLAEVKKPEIRAGWLQAANAALWKNAPFVTLRGHRQALRGAWFSPDGTRILTASADGTARVAMADGTGAPIVLEGHTAEVTSAAFSPHAKAEDLRVLTTSADGTARLWTLDGRAPTILDGGAGTSGQTTCGAYNADGTRVVISTMVSNAGKIESMTRLFATHDGSMLAEHREHHGRVFAGAFVGEYVVTVSEDKTALLWDGKNKGKITKLPGHDSPVFDVAVHARKRRIVMASEDGKARVFQVDEQGNAKLSATLTGHENALLHVALSHDGNRVVAGSADRTARVWDLDKDENNAAIVLGGHAGSVTWVAFHPTDASIVATASTDHQGRVFRTDVPNEPMVLEGHRSALRSIVWSLDGERLVTSGAEGDATARVWRADGLSAMGYAPHAAIGGQKTPTTMHIASFSDDGAVWAAAFDDAAVEIRRVHERSQPVVLRAPEHETWRWVTAVAANSDGSRIALSSLGEVRGAVDGPLSKPALHIFVKGDSWTRSKRIEVPAVIRALGWSRAGDRVVAGLENGGAMVFDVDADKSAMVFQGHEGWVTGVVMSPDGTRFVTTSVDGTARIFDMKSPDVPLKDMLFSHAVNAVAFEPRGEFVATAGSGGEVFIIPIRGGAPTQLDAKHGELEHIAFSRDGKRLAATSANGTIVVWSALSFPLSSSPNTFVLDAGGPVLGLDVGEHEIWAVTAARTLHWDLDIDSLKSALRTQSRDCLLPTVRVQYLNESADEALRAYKACEEAEGRAEPVNPSIFMVTKTGGWRGRVLVLPGRSTAELDGHPVSKRAGFLEIVGVVGEKKKLRLFKGETSIEKEILLGASGAEPAFVDIDAELALRRGTSGPVRQNKEVQIDPLMPDGF